MATDWEIKRDQAVAILKAIEPPEGYYLAFSGGKDSCVIKALADIAGVKYDAHYAVSGIDPPELVRFIRDVHPDVKREMNASTMFKLIPKNGPPGRHSRWCCKLYKECGGKGRITILGVRREESATRVDREMLSVLRKQVKLNIIIDWNEGDVWEFITHHDIPYCSLYDEGFDRLGCIGCPMASVNSRVKALKRWPHFEQAYRKSFRKYHEQAVAKGKRFAGHWPDGDAMFDWWISDKPLSDAAQVRIF